MAAETHAKETVALVVRPGERAIGCFRLVVMEGPDRGKERVSDGAELSIGTALGNHLVLSDRAVSRHHCLISATEKGFFLRDLGSRNGTLLAGFRVEGAYLGPGAVLR